MTVGNEPGIRSDETYGERGEGKILEVSSFSRYIDHTKRLMKLFRMWKLDDDIPKWKSKLVAVSTAVLLTGNLLLGLSELGQLQSAVDLPRIASGIGAFWLHFLGFFKWLYLACKVSAVMTLVGQLEDCYNLSLGLSDSDEDSSRLREEMGMAQRSSLRFFYVWSMFVIYGIVHWCVNPVLLGLSHAAGGVNASLDENVRLLPYEAWIPWDTTRSVGYWYAYLLEFVGGFASCIGSVSYDVFYLTMAMMICAQMRYLNHVLNDPNTEVSLVSKNEPTCYFLRGKLERSKIHHHAILKFLASLEKVTSPVMFVQCIGTMGILCLVSFQVTTIKLKGDMNNTIRVWSMFEYIIGCFTQLLAFCYYADEVTTLGLQVGDSAYSCGWESLESGKAISPGDNAARKDRKAIEFLIREIITRAQSPFRLTGGPFYVLSLETYRAVVSAAFSYSAVLRELGEE